MCFKRNIYRAFCLVRLCLGKQIEKTSNSWAKHGWRINSTGSISIQIVAIQMRIELTQQPFILCRPNQVCTAITLVFIVRPRLAGEKASESRQCFVVFVNCLTCSTQTVADFCFVQFNMYTVKSISIDPIVRDSTFYTQAKIKRETHLWLFRVFDFYIAWRQSSQAFCSNLRQPLLNITHRYILYYPIEKTRS